MRPITQSSPSPHQRLNSNASMLVFIAFCTFWFALLKMPLEMKVLSHASPPHLTIDDFYDKKARRTSAVDQRIEAAKIDAKESYAHFFHRRAPGTGHHDDNTDGAASDVTKEEEEMAQEVDKMVKHYLDEEMEERRHLRSGANQKYFSNRVKQVVGHYLADVHADADLDLPEEGEQQHKKKRRELVGGIPHEKEEDAFGEDISVEIQDIVNHHHDPDEI